MISLKHDASKAGSIRLTGVKVLFLSGLIAAQVGCAAVKNYSISSYQGPFPIGEDRYINDSSERSRIGLPPK